MVVATASNEAGLLCAGWNDAATAVEQCSSCVGPASSFLFFSEMTLAPGRISVASSTVIWRSSTFAVVFPGLAGWVRSVVQLRRGVCVTAGFFKLSTIVRHKQVR